MDTLDILIAGLQAEEARDGENEAVRRRAAHPSGTGARQRIRQSRRTDRFV